MGESTDFKSICAKFQDMNNSPDILPSNHRSWIPENNISSVHSNPSFKSVISELEKRNVPPPISKKPVVPLKPTVFQQRSVSGVGDSQKDFDSLKNKSSTDAEAMKRKKMFRQTLNIVNSQTKELDGKCENTPQNYRRFSDSSFTPSVSTPKSPANPTVDEVFYELVDQSLIKEDPAPTGKDHTSTSNEPSLISVASSNRPESTESTLPPSSYNFSEVKRGKPPNPKGSASLLSTEKKNTSLHNVPPKKALPSIASLGPPPQKDPRPPKVDLSVFLSALFPKNRNKEQMDQLSNFSTVSTEEKKHEPPVSSPTPKEGRFHEDILQQNESNTTDENVYEMDPVLPEEERHEQSHTSLMPKEVLYDDTLTPDQSTAAEYVYEREPDDIPPTSETGQDSYYEVSMDSKVQSEYEVKTTEESKCQSKEKPTTRDRKTEKNEAFGQSHQRHTSEDAIYTTTVVEDCKGGKNMLHLKKGDVIEIVRITNCPMGMWMAKNSKGNYGFVPVSSIETSKDLLMFSNRVLRLDDASSVVYDDIEGNLNESRSATDISLTSDNGSEKSEDTYDDIAIKSHSPNNSGGKLKGFANLFKKEKNKMKGKKKEEDVSNSIAPTSNQDDLTETNAVIYDDTEINKDNKNNIGQGKKKKCSKQEKVFREKFKYTQEIVVINTAVVNDLATISTKGKLDLPVKAGEELEIIDITDENQIICRNSSGHFGYVQIEYLNFTSKEFS